jgi:hypothetical protein
MNESTVYQNDRIDRQVVSESSSVVEQMMSNINAIARNLEKVRPSLVISIKRLKMDKPQ